MGLSFSCPFAAYTDLETGLKSITLEDGEVKSLGLSCSFKIQDSQPSAMQLMVSQTMKIEKSLSFKLSENERLNHVEKIEISHDIESPRFKNVLLDDDLDLGSPKHEAATKLQKVYKSFRTRRKLADCAVLIEQSWWKLLDFAELKRSSISFFDLDKHETAISRWSRARTRAAKVGKGLSKNSKAQKLALQHWLEAIDPRHRYGHNLHFYYGQWLHSQSKEPFFYWLDIGEGKEVNLVEKCPRSKLQQQCIKYLGPMERKEYEVVIENGKLLYKQTGEYIDTTGTSKGSKWIFVLSTSRTLYVGIKKKGLFQHSSFLAGGATLAAGRLVSENGVLKAIWPHSGHYRPTQENFEDFVSFLNENNVDTTYVKMDSDDDDNGSLGKQSSSIHIRTHSSEEDVSEKERKDDVVEDHPVNIVKQLTCLPLESPKKSRLFRCSSRKLRTLKIPKNDDLFTNLRTENSETVFDGYEPVNGGTEDFTSTIKLDGYEAAEDFNSNQIQDPSDDVSDDEEDDRKIDETVPKKSILKRINSHKSTSSFQLGRQLSCKWSTGAGPRIGCLRDYPTELQSQALERENLSPRSGPCSQKYTSGSPCSFDNKSLLSRNLGPYRTRSLPQLRKTSKGIKYPKTTLDMLAISGRSSCYVWLGFGLSLDDPFIPFKLMGFFNPALCDTYSKDSAPLGFQISWVKNLDHKANNLVSQNGVFQFGFLEKDGGEFVVGIRYNLGQKSANLPVWTVGGGVRVSINSTFTLSMDGRLILIENPNSIVWSSDTSNLGVQSLTLLNNGNLVLMGSEKRLIWESFNRPTNTLLAGQSLRYPQNLRAPSTRSVTSYYTFALHRAEGVALMWESNVTYWRTSLSSPVEKVRFDSTGVLGLYDETDKLVSSITSKDFGESLVSLRHVRIDQDGNLRIYSWDDVVKSWRVGWQAVEDQCDVFGSCGLYSLCGYNSSGPICECLYSGSFDWGDGSRSPADSGGSSCKKMVDLGNCNGHTSMTSLKQTDLYGLYPPHDVEMMLSEDACKDLCSNDTGCFAVTSKNDGSGLCTLKRTGFISGSVGPSVPSTSFLKVCLVPQAVAAKGANPNVTPKEISFPFRGGFRRIVSAIAFVVLVTVLAILGLEMFVVLFVYHRRRKNREKIAIGKGVKMKLENTALLRLSFKEVQELTSGFSVQLGSSVFKGLLDEIPVTAKVLDLVSAVSEKEFLKAVSILGGTHHRNLASLQGFCFEPKHKILIYEYSPNGSADKWLFDPDRREKNWQQRVDIAVGVARAVAYLHTECRICIPHGNLKLENVLLDDKMVPKVTDFGISTFFLKIEGSSSSNESPLEKDIYMLGKMLLEIVLCCRDTVGDGLDQVMERVIAEQHVDIEDLKGVERVVRIGLWCMQNQPVLRPSVGEVMKVLEGTLSVDRPPSSFPYRNDDGEEREVSGAEIESGS
ncbi:hypothetical protein OSB04_010099 [Centaurea solstitialis]|uniref:Uncharacterized protein n=1 Tax=Centaurea solstitialis TaxID=347529 RepID=A0AA38WKB0_9ASTR|nr:hypothetical protein OSB04_010099 [Centaurea solstitialis]